MGAIILGVSVALQFAAAVVALRLVRLTGRRAAWILIAAAVTLMAVRRIITLVRVVSTGSDFSPDLSAELVALLISTLMLAGVAVIGPIFRSIRTSEEAVRESEQRFRELFEESPIAILEQDLSSLKQGISDLETQEGVIRALEEKPEIAGKLLNTIRVLGVNRAAVELFGAKDAEHLMQNLQRIATPRLLETFNGFIEGLMRGVSMFEDETEILNLAGERRYVIMRLSVPAMHKESLARVLVSASDVTERHEMQARLMVSDRMASIGTLAAGVAHEINNPLTYVMGNLSLLNRTVTEKSGRGYIAEAIEGTDRVRDIVNDLQDFSRSDRNTSVFDVASAVDLAARMAGSQIRPRAQLVIETIDQVWVRGNRSRLTQVILNLLVNAAQAIPAGNQVQNKIALRMEADDETVNILVCDTGSGIPREFLPRIFEPFFTTKGPGTGTGLGLYICRNIVTEMAGELSVVRSSTEGTEFRISLPRCERGEGTLEEEPEPAKKVTTVARRVLVIDDESAIRRLVPKILVGHEVVTVASGREAIKMLETEHFDVILCDLIMSDLTGMDVYEYIKGEHPSEAGKVVFMSGGVFTDRAREFLAEVPNARASKPFTAEELLEVLKPLLD